jgi:hypothetical protein
VTVNTPAPDHERLGGANTLLVSNTPPVGNLDGTLRIPRVGAMVWSLLAACSPDPTSTPRMPIAGVSDASNATTLTPAGSTVGEDWLTVAWEVESNGSGSPMFGWSIASAGDINGDGFGDVVVGAPWVHPSHLAYGEFWYPSSVAFLGSASGLGTTPAWFGLVGHEHQGLSVASAGDVNDDGFDDILVGGSFEMAYVWHGSPTGPALLADWSVNWFCCYGNSTGFGEAVASAGDVNGDGFDDVIIGAPGVDGPGVADDGAVYLFSGGAEGLDTTESWSVLADGTTNNFLGRHLAPAGDVNADGYADIVIGSTLYANPDVDEGAAFVYLGSASGPESDAAWMAESNQAEAIFGFQVASTDVNGDGFSDVLVSAPLFDGAVLDAGAAFVYLGSSTGLEPDPASIVEGDAAAQFLGTTVASAGDLDGDGFGDVAFSSSFGYYEDRSVVVYRGSDSGLGPTAAWSSPVVPYSGFGFSVASAGDVNGDGFSDLAATDPAYSNGQSFEGRAVVYHGGDLPAHGPEVVGLTIMDLGDGDGQAERGEELEVIWSVRNTATIEATNVATVTSTSDVDVTVTAAEGVPLGGPHLAAGVTDDVVGTIVEIASDCVDDHDAALTVVLSWDLGSVQATFNVPVVCDLPLTLTTEPWVLGQPTTSTVTGALPSESVIFVLTTRGVGAGPCPPPMNGACFDIRSPFLKVQRQTADANGVATWTMNVPNMVPVGADLWLQAAVARGVTSNVEARVTEP